MCRIVVDWFERRSGVPDGLLALGVDLDFDALRVGDYAVGDAVLVERKTVADLSSSLRRGRLWPQIGALRGAGRRPFLIVEGSLERSERRLRGACLAVIGQGVPILWSRHAVETAEWLCALGRRVAGPGLGRDRPAYAQRVKPSRELVGESMLAAVPGVSVARARALLDRFGSVAAVLAATDEEWLEVRGIGPAIARELRAAAT